MAVTAVGQVSRSAVWIAGARPCRRRRGKRSKSAMARKGPVRVQVAWTRVQARSEGQASDVAELLVVFRERQGDGSWKHDYLLSNGSAGHAGGRVRPRVQSATSP